MRISVIIMILIGITGLLALNRPNLSTLSQASILGLWTESYSATEHENDPNAGPPGIEDLKNLDERFTYEVRYGFFRIGNVHVYLKADTVYRGSPVKHLVTEMVSNRSLPLVGYKEAHYHNYIAYNDTIPYGYRFWQNSLHRDMMERYVFDYDYEAGKVFSYEEGEPVDTLALDRPADSGPSIMYYSRLHAGTETFRTYPIYIDHQRSEIEMNFTSRRESYESDAFPDEEFSAYYLEGNADFEGPFGFSGRFEAYFKDDKYRIPLEARVSVWLGSVRVRLVEYERLNGT